MILGRRRRAEPGCRGSALEQLRATGRPPPAAHRRPTCFACLAGGRRPGVPRASPADNLLDALLIEDRPVRPGVTLLPSRHCAAGRILANQVGDEPQTRRGLGGRRDVPAGRAATVLAAVDAGDRRACCRWRRRCAGRGRPPRRRRLGDHGEAPPLTLGRARPGSPSAAGTPAPRGRSTGSARRIARPPRRVRLEAVRRDRPADGGRARPGVHPNRVLRCRRTGGDRQGAGEPAIWAGPRDPRSATPPAVGAARGPPAADQTRLRRRPCRGLLHRGVARTGARGRVGGLAEWIGGANRRGSPPPGVFHVALGGGRGARLLPWLGELAGPTRGGPRHPCPNLNDVRGWPGLRSACLAIAGPCSGPDQTSRSTGSARTYARVGAGFDGFARAARRGDSAALAPGSKREVGIKRGGLTRANFERAGPGLFAVRPPSAGCSEVELLRCSSRRARGARGLRRSCAAATRSNRALPAGGCSPRRGSATRWRVQGRLLVHADARPPPPPTRRPCPRRSSACTAAPAATSWSAPKPGGPAHRVQLRRAGPPAAPGDAARAPAGSPSCRGYWETPRRIRAAFRRWARRRAKPFVRVASYHALCRGRLQGS